MMINGAELDRKREKVEKQAAAEHPELSALDKAFTTYTNEAAALAKSFSASWRAAIAAANADVLRLFANFVNGVEVLKQVLTQLLLYYTRFQEIVRKNWPRPPAFAKDIVPTAEILAEIKQYSRIF